MVCSITESQCDNKINQKYNRLYFLSRYRLSLFHRIFHFRWLSISCALAAALLCGLLLLSNTARADALLPVDMNTAVTISYDRSAPPARYIIWNDIANGYSRDNPALRNRDWFRCKSSTNTATGACSRAWIWGGGYVVSNLNLRFTEKRSKITVDIPLKGQNAACRYVTSVSCSILSSETGAYKQIQDGISTQGTTAKKLLIYLTAEDLGKIPAGGIWEGNLIIEQRQWSPNIHVADWTAQITLDVTDRNNGAIYLPAFGTADALVDLNLRTTPLSTAPGGEVSGSTTIDTCPV
ncbi:CfaE/CblD family pilus tip adhesin [Shimwellia pseudoproteus]|uniref:CfaE/CblD family pilus tip adhesin n=1 Tax=Shimwellia pseudoproteus TaxID=570012 RepID=UPI001E28BA07|nr:CfaE/CblD family pilus tip adhesin [Shimwellia pseudoproteus]